MKRSVFFFLIIAVLGITSCCRYRPYISYWDYDETIPVEVEKKDLRKAGQLR